MELGHFSGLFSLSSSALEDAHLPLTPAGVAIIPRAKTCLSSSEFLTGFSQMAHQVNHICGSKMAQVSPYKQNG